MSCKQHHPFTAVVAGSTGSGKSEWVLRMGLTRRVMVFNVLTTSPFCTLPLTNLVFVDPHVRQRPLTMRLLFLLTTFRGSDVAVVFLHRTQYDACERNDRATTELRIWYCYGKFQPTFNNYRQIHFHEGLPDLSDTVFDGSESTLLI